MAKNKRVKKYRTQNRKPDTSLRDVLSLYTKLADIKQQVDSFSETSSQSDERLTDLEVHINLLTRLLTTLCVERFGIKIGMLKKIVKRIEKEAVRDSQINELESLYKLSQDIQKKTPSSQPKSPEDPWDKIS